MDLESVEARSEDLGRILMTWLVPVGPGSVLRAVDDPSISTEYIVQGKKASTWFLIS